MTEQGYTDNDLPFMQAALARWIATAGAQLYCHVGDVPHRMYNGLRGRYPLDELVRLWRDGDQIIAFGMVYPHEPAFEVFLAPDHRGGDLERAALRWGHETAVARNDSDEGVIRADRTAHDTVREALLLELGYEEDGPYITLNTQTIPDDIPEPTLPDGYRFGSGLDDPDGGKLADVHSGAFDSDWTAAIYREQVMHKPGYDPARELVIIAPDGRFAAFTVTWHDAVNKTGLFEPVGTHKEFQRQGLARALLYHGLRDMRSHGMTSAMVGNEADEEGPAALYQGVGFTPLTQIIDYQRAI